MQVIYTHCEIFGKNGKVVRKKKNHLNSNKVIAVNILIYFLASFVCEFLYRWNHNNIFCAGFLFNIAAIRDFSMLLKILGKHNFLGYLAFCHTAIA